MLNPEEFRGWLPPDAFKHLRESCQALAERQYLSSAIWGAVFLEAFLDDMAATLKLPASGQDDLNARIQQLQQYSKNRGSAAIAIPDEYIKRCRDIQNTRNRLVHHCGAAKTTLAEDAQFINAGIKAILDWYKAVAPCRAAEPNVAASPHPPGMRVFLSVSKPHNAGQEYFLDELEERLRGIGIEPVRVVPSLYDKADPIGKTRQTIQSCRGMIVLGLERTHAYFLRDKEGTPNETEETHRQYTSGWLHVEAGMANALGLQVFVLCQKRIHGDGIFDRGWNTYPVAEMDSLDVSSPQLENFLQHVQAWVQAETGANPERRG